MDDNKNIIKPEDFEKIFLESQKKDNLLKSKYLNLRRRLRTRNFYSKTFFSPAVITVIITAVLGPFVVSKVNNDIKKEQIEYETAQRNRELQTKIIEKVLDYAFSTDYSKPEAIDRIGIVAQMIDENEKVFGLSFRKTINGFENIVAELDSGIIRENKKNILTLKTRISGLNIKLDNINKQKAQVDDLYKEGKISISEKNKQIDALNISYDNAVSEIQSKKGQIAFLQNQITEVKNNLLQTTERLNNVTIKNKEYIATIEKLKAAEILTKAQVNSLFEDFKEATKNINTLQEEIKNFRNNINKLQEENKILSHKNDSLKKVLQKLRENKQNS